LAAIDICEPQIIRALEKAGWQISEKPFTLRIDDRTVFADFSVRRVNEQGQLEEVIVLEVKCFTHPKNDLPEFYTAIGQYEFYRATLSLVEIDFPLYLAVPDKAFVRLMEDASVRRVIQTSDIHIVTVDIEREEIVKWII
jgi:hypothetical protein